MSDVRTLEENTAPLTRCPAAIVYRDGHAAACGAPLAVILTTTVRGDDYGSFSVYSVTFECGHSLADMEAGVRHADEL